MKHYFFSTIFIFLLILPNLYSQDFLQCEDEVCTLSLNQNQEKTYAVISPVGYHAIPMITQAKRLSTLEGKRIALVGGSFMANTTHYELKKCIEKEFPQATVFLFEEISSGGPFTVFGATKKTRDFQQRLQDMNIDVLISGNCGCGLCTTKETGSSIAAEYIGIPTVTVGSKIFIEQIHSIGVTRGVPVLRTAEYPGAFASHSSDELQKNAREILWPQIKKALTTPITSEEIAKYAPLPKRPANEAIFYGTYEEIQTFFYENNWTDGLPIQPPTLEKIEEYLQFSAYEGNVVLGTFALAYRETSVYTVAANAIMAGVPKEFMPICIAFVQGMNNGNWRKPLASTHGWTPFAWLNGPLARQLGIDSNQGMISEKNNKALGRFIELCMLNIGGYYIKENRMGTFGYLTPWTFAEDEKACLSVGWEPYHTTKGYDLNANTITAGSALNWGNNITPATEDSEKIMNLIAFDITEKQQNGLGNTNPQVPRTIFITQQVAEDLAKQYETKEQLENALIKTARRPLSLRAYAHYWANTGSQQTNRRSFFQHYSLLEKNPQEKAKKTPTPEWFKDIIPETEIMTIATMNKGETAFLVADDPNRNKVQVMPGGNFVTTEIVLPQNWNELVKDLGYEPIENFYLEQISKEKKAKSQQVQKNKRMVVPQKHLNQQKKMNYSKKDSKQ